MFRPSRRRRCARCCRAGCWCPEHIQKGPLRRHRLRERRRETVGSEMHVAPIVIAKRLFNLHDDLSGGRIDF